MGKENQTAEIKRRIKLTWIAFGKLNIVKNPDIPINLKRKIFNACILPVATYGLETKALTKKYTNNLRIMQRAMERAMFGVILRNIIRKEKIKKTNEGSGHNRASRGAYVAMGWACCQTKCRQMGIKACTLDTTANKEECRQVTEEMIG